MGFKDYSQYLTSKIWTATRRRVFADKGTQCIGCGIRADVVHHMTYSLATLRGEDITHLVPICNGCHTFVEYVGSRKLEIHEMQTVASVYLRVPMPPDIVEQKPKNPVAHKKKKRSHRTKKQRRRVAIEWMGGTGHGSVANHARVLKLWKAARPYG